MTTAPTFRFRLSQVWRDPALRSVPLWIVVAALNTSVLMGVVSLRLTRDQAEPLPTRQLALILGLALAVYLLAGGIRTRCRRLDMTLPLPTRNLWAVHSTATYLAGLLIVLACAAVLAAHMSILSRISAFAWAGNELARICARLAAVWFLAVMVMQSYDLDLRKPQGRKSILVSLGTAGAIPILAVLLDGQSLFLMIVPVVVGAALGFQSFNRLPPSFSQWPLEASSRGASSAASKAPAATGTGPSQLSHGALVARVLFHTPPWGAATGWIALLFIAGLGFLMSGVLRAWEPDADVRLWVATMTVYMLLAFFAPLTFRLPTLDPLPVSRRFLFALLVLPAVIGLMLGYGGGWLTQKLMGDDTRRVHYRVEMPYYWVSVPYSNLEVVWDGEVPEITSPWGESHPASGASLFRGSKATLYSPYNTPEEASASFEALLLSRAIEAVHGVSIPHQEILDRYFEVDGDRLIGLKPTGPTLEQDYPNLGRVKGQRQFLFLMAFVLVPWFLLLAVFLRTFRASLSDRMRQVTFWSLLGLSLLLMLGQVAMAVTGIARPDVLRGTMEVMLRHANDSTLAALASASACLLLMGLGYLLAQRQLVDAEIPMPPTRFTLMDFSQES